MLFGFATHRRYIWLQAVNKALRKKKDEIDARDTTHQTDFAKYRQEWDVERIPTVSVV